jgi:Protein of unknown function (DUF1569)
MKSLIAQIKELESHIGNQKLESLQVSASNVGWHIDHCLLVIINIVEVLKKSNPDTYKWKFKPIRTVVLTLGKIPRGKGKAPKSVVPTGNFDVDAIQEKIKVAYQKVEETKALVANNNFEHPFFGQLNSKQTIRFLQVHNKHHLLIIDEIILAQKQ